MGGKPSCNILRSRLSFLSRCCLFLCGSPGFYLWLPSFLLQEQLKKKGLGMFPTSSSVTQVQFPSPSPPRFTFFDFSSCFCLFLTVPDPGPGQAFVLLLCLSSCSSSVLICLSSAHSPATAHHGNCHVCFRKPAAWVWADRHRGGGGSWPSENL